MAHRRGGGQQFGVGRRLLMFAVADPTARADHPLEQPALDRRRRIQRHLRGHLEQRALQAGLIELMQ